MNAADPTATSVVHLGPEVIAKRMDDKMVLVHPGTDKIYELNHTAGRIWELLSEGKNLRQTRQELAREFDVEEAAIVDEIHELLSMLVSEKLATVERPRPETDSGS